MNTSWKTQVKQLITHGEALCHDGRLPDALNCLNSAYDLIPEPKQTSELTRIVLCNIGELHIRQERPELAFNDFSNAVKCKHGLGNPQIHMRLGQLQYERGNMERAKDELMRAYMGAGDAVFEGENPKYFSLIQRFL